MKKEYKKNCTLIRKKILNLSKKVSALHIGGSFSSVELIERIFFKLKKKNDTFILSKGHAGILLYVVLNILGKIDNKNLSYILIQSYMIVQIFLIIIIIVLQIREKIVI